MKRTLLLSLLVALFLFYLFVIWTNAVNIPYFDDWDLLNRNQLPGGLSFEWLVARHNEHRIATTKLLIWLQYQLTGWNIVTHQVLNFLLYGLLLWVVYLFVRRAERVADWVILAFLLFLLSPINHENHAWAIQSNIHIWILLLLLSAYFYFGPQQRWREILLGCLAAVLSMYSNTGGVFAALVVLVFFAGFKIARARSEKSRRELFQLLTVVGVVLVAVALWSLNYEKPVIHPPSSPPYGLDFWRFFLKETAFSFGVDNTGNVKLYAILGAATFLLIIAPVCWLLVKGKLSGAQWASVSVTTAILVVMAAIAYGRAGFGQWMATVSRYSEHGLMLIPLTLLNWNSLLQTEKARRNFNLALWAFFFVTFFNNWAQFDYYKIQYAKRTEGVECVKAYYEGRGPARCPTIYPEEMSLTEQLEGAKNLNTSFYKAITGGQ